MKIFMTPILDEDRSTKVVYCMACRKKDFECGCRDPLVTWNDILIDGHNRYTICLKLGQPFKTIAKEFADREAVMDWIDANQLGRRNLKPDQMSVLRGRRYNRAKKLHGGTGSNQHKQSGQNVHSAKTADNLVQSIERTMPRDDQMRQVRRAVNDILDRAAVAAETGGAAAVLALKLPDSDELPPKPPMRISEAYAAQLRAQSQQRQCDCGGGH